MSTTINTRTAGIVAVFSLVNGDKLRLRFQAMRPVTMGRRLDFGFLGLGARAVHDGTFHNPNYNQRDFDAFLEGSQRKGFYQIGDKMVPLSSVAELKLEHFEYDAPLNPEIYQGD